MEKYDPSKTEAIAREMRETLEAVLTNCHPDRLFKVAKFYGNEYSYGNNSHIMRERFVREISQKDLEEHPTRFRLLKQRELSRIRAWGDHREYREQVLDIAASLAVGTRYCTLVKVSEEPTSSEDTFRVGFYEDSQINVPLEMYYQVASH